MKDAREREERDDCGRALARAFSEVALAMTPPEGCDNPEEYRRARKRVFDALNEAAAVAGVDIGIALDALSVDSTVEIAGLWDGRFVPYATRVLSNMAAGEHLPEASRLYAARALAGIVGGA